MAYIGNTPTKGSTILQLEARKSFAFGVQILDTKRRPVDITGCTLRIVMKTTPLDGEDFDDGTNLITNSVAELIEPTIGYARFDLQALDFSASPGEYPYAVVLWTPAGYSAVIIKGTIELLPNTEFLSLGQEYVSANSPQRLDVLLRGMVAVEVSVGSILPPGMNYFSDSDSVALEGLVDRFSSLDPFGTAAYRNEDYFARADATVPPGGFRGRVLGKVSNSDFDVDWLNIDTGGGGGSGLDATAIPAGRVPTAQGDDLWEWSATVANADDLIDGTTKVVMTTDERSQLASVETGAEVNVQPDWAAPTGTAEEILNKPALDFAPTVHTHRLADLDGFSVGTVDPTGGVAGDVYLKYTL